MTAAFGFCLPLSILIVTNRKNFACLQHDMGEAFGNNDRYLIWHQNLNFLALALIITGVIIVMSQADNHFDSSHSQIGMFIVCLTLIQPIIARYRPSYDEKYRNKSIR